MLFSDITMNTEVDVESIKAITENLGTSVNEVLNLQLLL